jgi:hypothetical protein
MVMGEAMRQMAAYRKDNPGRAGAVRNRSIADKVLLSQNYYITMQIKKKI